MKQGRNRNASSNMFPQQSLIRVKTYQLLTGKAQGRGGPGAVKPQSML